MVTVGVAVATMRLPIRTVTSSEVRKSMNASAGVVGVQPSRVSSLTRYSLSGPRSARTSEPSGPVSRTATGEPSW
jgi:hypothetical protein